MANCLSEMYGSTWWRVIHCHLISCCHKMETVFTTSNDWIENTVSTNMCALCSLEPEGSISVHMSCLLLWKSSWNGSRLQARLNKQFQKSDFLYWGRCSDFFESITALSHRSSVSFTHSQHRPLLPPYSLLPAFSVEMVLTSAFNLLYSSWIAWQRSMPCRSWQ